VSRSIPPLHRLLYGGLLGILLSVTLAEYTSISLFNLYHNSYLIRDTFGISPNYISDILLKFSWAIVCLTSWWMIWKLDFFLSKPPPPKQNPAPDLKDEPPKPSPGQNSSRNTAKVDSPKQKESACDRKENTKTKEDKGDKQTLQDLHFAKILEMEDTSNMTEIKSSYRQKIAQYHPDRVSAMGPEIREIAEKKAKEINEAYEYFRKKFKSLK